MSKKEIRRAARDAFPKAKNASTARGRGKSGAYNKRKPTAAARPAARSSVPRPASIKRSLILGVFAGIFYFVFIHWIFHIDPRLVTNIVISVIAAFLFAGVNYWSEGIKYRRYMAKNKDSSK